MILFLGQSKVSSKFCDNGLFDVCLFKPENVAERLREQFGIFEDLVSGKVIVGLEFLKDQESPVFSKF